MVGTMEVPVDNRFERNQPGTGDGSRSKTRLSPQDMERRGVCGRSQDFRVDGVESTVSPRVPL